MNENIILFGTARKWDRPRIRKTLPASGTQAESNTYTMNSLFILPRPCLAFVHQPREFYLFAGTALRHIANDCVSLENAFSYPSPFAVWLTAPAPSFSIAVHFVLSKNIIPLYCVERPWRWRFKRNGIRSRTIKKVKYAYRNLQHVRVRARKPYNYLFIVCNL